MLIEETPIIKERLPIEAFRAHMRLGTGFGLDDVQDPVIVAFLRASLAAAEARTGRILVARDFLLTVSAWHSADCMRFPILPVRAIHSVELLAHDGSRVMADPATYWLERDLYQPRLRAVASRLPTIEAAGSAEVSLRAGVTETWEALPADLQQAVLMLAAHYYEYRDSTNIGSNNMPFGVSSLLERHRILRLGKGPEQ
ncbi:MAG: head-tail connector protein [Pseudomonadota bacterium]